MVGWRGGWRRVCPSSLPPSLRPNPAGPVPEWGGGRTYNLDGVCVVTFRTVTFRTLARGLLQGERAPRFALSIIVTLGRLPFSFLVPSYYVCHKLSPLFLSFSFASLLLSRFIFFPIFSFLFLSAFLVPLLSWLFSKRCHFLSSCVFFHSCLPFTITFILFLFILFSAFFLLLFLVPLIYLICCKLSPLFFYFDSFIIPSLIVFFFSFHFFFSPSVFLVPFQFILIHYFNFVV